MHRGVYEKAGRRERGQGEIAHHAADDLECDQHADDAAGALELLCSISGSRSAPIFAAARWLPQRGATKSGN